MRVRMEERMGVTVRYVVDLIRMRSTFMRMRLVFAAVRMRLIFTAVRMESRSRDSRL